MAWKHRKCTRRKPQTWLLAEIVLVVEEIKFYMRARNDEENKATFSE